MKAKRLIAAGIALIALVIFFFCAPVVYYNPVNNAGNVSGYESLSCALFNIGVTYGSPSFLANYWTLMLRCGNITWRPFW